MKQPQELLLIWISRVCTPQEVNWLQAEVNRVRVEKKEKDFSIAFAKVPRKVKKVPLKIEREEILKAQAARSNWHPENLDSEQAARILLLLSFPYNEPEGLGRMVEKLLGSADLNEQLAIYSALPLFPNPEKFLQVAHNGTRFNATSVFDAIALDNPYPSENFSEDAYNRLVLKAVFMERPFMRIVGIPERANPALAELLLDLVSERWSAGREVDPLLWCLISPALTKERYNEFKTRAKQQCAIDVEAVSLAYSERKSSSAPESGKWKSIEKKMKIQKQL